tara:strand:- start:109 stop:384 length:276 start_codon:yes stop_codon:yes gene_type:complete
MQEKYLRLLEELDLYFKDMDGEDKEWDNLLVKVSSVSKNVNKCLSEIEELQKDVAILKSESHPPVFTKDQYKDLIKRIKKVENGKESTKNS